MSIDICQELHQNFIDYAYECNSQRAFPDARDGLKPGQRAALWEMYIKGYSSSKPHVKSAKISGGVIGSWWPHGDVAVYDTFARMSQSWINNIPEVDWHGANGSQVGGPECAAARYTEARLSKAVEDGYFTSIKKNTVPMIQNFSEDEEWPEVFPAIFPRLMVNGSQGIGVTIANYWAPNNLIEVSKKIIEYLNNGTITYDDIYPDFPSGGVIINKKDIADIYKTGKGKIVLRGKVEIVDNSILISELPYQVYVEPFIDEIKELINKEEITGIRDIYNKSDKHKLLIEIECEKSPATILKILFSKTSLQKSYNPNQYALVGKTPQLLNLEDYIKIYIEHNISCIQKEYEFDLKKAESRKEIVDGLLIALEHIDNIIALIKKAESSKDAKIKLMEVYSLTERQADAIVNMKLGKLAKLESIELEKEKKELQTEIDSIKVFLASTQLQNTELENRLITFMNKYGNPRRTEITQLADEKEDETTYVEPENCVVIMTEVGNIKRIPASSFKITNRNTKGVKTQADITSHIIRTNTIDTLLVFTNKGTMYRLLVDNIPVGNNSTKGTSIKALIEMESDEKPEVIYSVNKDTDSKYVLFVTKQGMVKKTPIEEYIGTKKKNGIVATKLREGDSLAAIALVKDEDIMLFSSGGNGIRFKSSEITSTSRNTVGVKGITLNANEQVISVAVIRDINDDLAVFAKNGQGLRIKLSDITTQSRGGKGLQYYKDGLAATTLVNDEDNLLICGNKSSICISAKTIPVLNRGAMGNIIIKDNHIQSISKI